MSKLRNVAVGLPRPFVTGRGAIAAAMDRRPAIAFRIPEAELVQWCIIGCLPYICQSCYYFALTAILSHSNVLSRRVQERPARIVVAPTASSTTFLRKRTHLPRTGSDVAGLARDVAVPG